MWKFSFLLFLICFVSILQAQVDLFDATFQKHFAPYNIGPAGMSGRVTAIAVDPTNKDRILIGAASGGVWESLDGGSAWTPIFEEVSTQSIGAIAIHPLNPSEIWVGTGEGNPRNSLNSGKGIFRSLDRGKNWTCMGLEKTKLIHRISIHPQLQGNIVVGALGSAWGPNKERGVFVTNDAGKSWSQTLSINDETGCGEIVRDPQNPQKLIAAMWEFGRKPWTFNSGGKGSGLYVSFDGGTTWTKRTVKDGIPEGDLGRIGIAIAPSKPEIVYALIEAKENALYKSIDGGFSFKKVTDKNIGNRPFYYAELYVDPKNENRIFNLYSVVDVSNDGGKTFESLLGFSGFTGVHPDHHAWWIDPTDPNFIINGNDGGLNISRDGGAHWKFSDNLAFGQFYHISIKDGWNYQVGGGLQDNGSWVGPSFVRDRGGIKNHHWQEISFGDGFDVAFSTNDDWVYSMSQGGNLLRHTTSGAPKTQFIKPTHADTSVALRFNWNAALAMHPMLPCGLYYGSQFLHLSTDCGESWRIISPDLTTNDTTKQQQQLSGGLTIDDTAAENYTTIISIAPSPIDSQVIWVGTDDGRLQLTRNGGKEWVSLESKLPGCPKGAWIAQIRASQYRANEVFIVVNDYRRNNWSPYAYHSDNFGKTFRRIVDEKSVSSFCLSFYQDPELPSLLFLGADDGLYLSFDDGKNWKQWNKGFPAVPVNDMAFSEVNDELVLGTFGRSIWILNDIRALRDLAKAPLKKQNVILLSGQDGYLMNYQSVKGNRFIADGTFVGPNRDMLPTWHVWRNPEVPKDTSTAKSPASPYKSDKYYVKITNSIGDTVRQYSQKSDTGWTSMRWDGRGDGIFYPSRKLTKPEDEVGTGREQMPGNYKAYVYWNTNTMEQSFELMADPELPFQAKAYAAYANANDAWEDQIKTLYSGSQAILDMQQQMQMHQQRAAMEGDSMTAKWKRQIEPLQKRSNALLDELLGKENQKGIRRSEDHVMSKFWRVRSYMDENWLRGDQAMQDLLVPANAARQAWLLKLSDFMSLDWATYTKWVESQSMSLIKPLDPIKE